MRLNVRSIRRGGAVLSAALLMAWPALYNGYPLLYPDSVAYVQDGPVVARALFLHKISDYFGMRSLIYSVGIFPFHWGINLAPVVALQAALTAYVLWLVVRSLAPRRTVIGYFAVVAALALFTGLGWIVSLIMPDILGPLLYLCIYLLVFAPESLSRGERLTLIPLAWWAAASHVTHLILAAGMCVLLASLLVFRRRPNALRWQAVGGVAVIVLMAVAAQLALNAYLYDSPSLDHEQPPFLTARVIADGPGRWYLERHCGNSELAVCDYVKNLPRSTDSFLWDEDGIWQNASTEQQDLLRRQEMRFVMATLCVYPRQQLLISLHNFWRQLTTFDLSEDASDLFLDGALPGAGYAQGRQAQQKLPEELFTSVQSWTVITSIALIGVFTTFAWRRLSSRLAGLGVVILFAVIANAFVTGVLSEVNGRYQSRVVWLLPLLAGGFVLEWIEQRSSRFALQHVAREVVPAVAASSAASLNP